MPLTRDYWGKTMTESCAYVKKTYNVPADIGRRVVVDGKPGIIAADKGTYIGVNFDEDQPGVIKNCHPTWNVEYLEMGQIRVKKMTAGQERYQQYRDADWFDGTFAEWLGVDKESRRRRELQKSLYGSWH